MRPTMSPARGNNIKTNKVSFALIINKKISMPIIFKGSLMIPSNAPITEFSSSVMSLEDLLKISPLRCSVK